MSSSVTHYNCFDSLIARRCRTSEELFRLIESRTSVTDFAKERTDYEKQNLSLDEIYRLLASKRTWAIDETELFKKIEIATEREQIFPIVEKTRKVQAGDVIHNNSKLPNDAIVELLKVCGIEEDVVVANNSFADQHEESLKSPETEELLPLELARLARTLRLSNPHTRGSVEYQAWFEQTQYNIPVLILAALTIPKDSVSFIVPETLYLQRIHEEIHKTTNPTLRYLPNYYISPPSGYQGYIRRAKRNGAAVELHETARSLKAWCNYNLNTQLDFLSVSKKENEKLLLWNTASKISPEAAVQAATENIRYFKLAENIKNPEEELAKLLETIK